MHGGVKFYNGAAKAARAYVERDRSRADDYYLAEGSGVAERSQVTPDGVEHAGSMNGEAYEQWVAGIDIETGANKGRVRDDVNALRFVEVVVTGPRRGHWLPRSIRRSSAGSPVMRPPGSGRGDGRCRCRLRASRPR